MNLIDFHPDAAQEANNALSRFICDMNHLMGAQDLMWALLNSKDFFLVH